MPMTELVQQVRDEARRRGVRWTTQRQVIVETFLGSDGHLTVDQLHRRVRELDATVSTATVYRTVHLMQDIGVAQKRQFGEGSASYESAVEKHHHDHLVCTACGTIVEFEHQEIEDLQEHVARSHGFDLVTHRLELYGICATCRAKGVAPPLPKTLR